MEIIEIGLVLFAGFIAGIINTLAGSGSLVTLPLLVFMGLPVTVANGTNRIGVLVQSIVGFTTMQRKGDFPVKNSLYLILATVLGAIAGAMIAADLDERIMNLFIGSLMVFMLLVVMIKPKKWLRDKSSNSMTKPGLGTILLFVGIGFYGGFIQAGVGIFILSGLVLSAGYNLVHANAIKLLMVMVYTIPALAVFIMNDQVHWGFGLLIAVGQALGAWVAARFATSSPSAAIWIRRLLIVVIVVSAIKFFNLWEWLIISF